MARDKAPRLCHHHGNDSLWRIHPPTQVTRQSPKYAMAAGITTCAGVNLYALSLPKKACSLRTDVLWRDRETGHGRRIIS